MYLRTQPPIGHFSFPEYVKIAQPYQSVDRASHAMGETHRPPDVGVHDPVLVHTSDRRINAQMGLL